jgi:predicted Zn-dependent peptidase
MNVIPTKEKVIGTSEVIAGVSRETILNYYLSWYTPENMTTIVVGDFNKQKLLICSLKSLNSTRKEKLHRQKPKRQRTGTDTS